MFQLFPVAFTGIHEMYVYVDVFYSWSILKGSDWFLYVSSIQFMNDRSFNVPSLFIKQFNGPIFIQVFDIKSVFASVKHKNVPLFKDHKF